MKSMFQITRPDKFSFAHFFGSLFLFFMFIVFYAPEHIAFLLTFLCGCIFEVGQWDGYKSEEGIDLTDLLFDFLGAVAGLIILTGF